MCNYKMGKIQLLVMVKNGEELIRETIEKCPADRIMIFDTGSTDSTKQIVSDLPQCVLINIPFTNFSDTRNKCMDISSCEDYEWTIFLDDSYLISDYSKLKKELKYIPKSICAVSIDIITHNLKYESIRITRTQPLYN